MKQEKEEEAAAAKEEEVRKKREDAKLAEREEREAQIYRVRLRCSLDAINRMARQTNRNDNVKKTARAGGRARCEKEVLCPAGRCKEFRSLQIRSADRPT